LIGALRTRRHVAIAVAVTASALAVATLTWRHQHPNRDGRVVVLDARTGAVIAERSLSGGWVVAAMLPRRQVAIADSDTCERRSIIVYDDRLRPLRTGRAAYACDISRPNQLRARVTGSTVRLLDGYEWTTKGVAVPLGRGWLSERPNGLLIAYDALGHERWRRDVGSPAGLVDAGQGRVVATVAGTYTAPPAA
jgi:hypothetical protein